MFEGMSMTYTSLCKLARAFNDLETTALHSAQSVYSTCVHTTQTVGKTQSGIEQNYWYECRCCIFGHSNDIFQTVYHPSQTQMHTQTKVTPPFPRAAE